MGEHQKRVMDPANTRALRQRMIQSQLATRGLHDPKVLHAMQHIPREVFVPELPVETVYRDGPLSIGHGQTISQPYMVAVMASLLHLNGFETVLEVGAGSGYGAAILARKGLGVSENKVSLVFQWFIKKQLRGSGGRHGPRRVWAEPTVYCPKGIMSWRSVSAAQNNN